MLLGTTVNDNEIIQIEDIDVPCNLSVKLLGVEIDNKLTFDVHVSRICRKAALQLNSLRRVVKFLNYETKFIVFNSFVFSKL